MGLFTQRPEEPIEWAGLPSEPERAETAAERLRGGGGSIDIVLPGFPDEKHGAVEYIAIPVEPPADLPSGGADDGD